MLAPKTKNPVGYEPIDLDLRTNDDNGALPLTSRETAGSVRIPEATFIYRNHSGCMESMEPQSTENLRSAHVGNIYSDCVTLLAVVPTCAPHRYGSSVRVSQHRTPRGSAATNTWLMRAVEKATF